jgi:predicted double-glycine peptidase
VLYKIDEQRVYLADPSWGRTRMEFPRFERLWRTEEGALYGRFLTVLPQQGEEARYQAWAISSRLYGNIIAVKDLMPF